MPETVCERDKNKLAWVNQGRAFHTQGNLTEAIDCYDQAINCEWFSDSQLQDVWFSKGLALHAQGELPKAIDCYNQALAIGKSNAALYNKGLAREVQGNLAEAIKCYNQRLGYPCQGQTSSA